MNPRIENLLQISADTSEDIRQQVPDMDAGFDDSDRTWEIIVKTAGSPVSYTHLMRQLLIHYHILQKLLKRWDYNYS